MRSTEVRGIQSIHWAIGLLRAVAANSERGCRLSELSNITKLHSFTARRMPAALAAESILAYDPAAGSSPPSAFQPSARDLTNRDARKQLNC